MSTKPKESDICFIMKNLSVQTGKSPVVSLMITLSNKRQWTFIRFSTIAYQRMASSYFCGSGNFFQGATLYKSNCTIAQSVFSVVWHGVNSRWRVEQSLRIILRVSWTRRYFSLNNKKTKKDNRKHTKRDTATKKVRLLTGSILLNLTCLIF